MNPDSFFREVLESHELRSSDVGLPEFLRLRSICFQQVACVAFLRLSQGM